MGLDYKTLSNKPIIKIKDKNGNIQTCKDLLPVTTFGYPQQSDAPCIVNKYYVARPDLISLAFYGSDEYADIICKVNGISNPFELNEDDTLNIPPVNNVSLYSTNNKGVSELLSDDETTETLLQQKTSLQKEHSKKRSPNEQSAGESNYIIDRSLGLVFY